MIQVALDEWLEKERKIIVLKRKTMVAEMKQWKLWKKTLPLIDSYREIKIPKKKGGYRTINIPPNDLKETQGGILRFLQDLWKVWHVNICGLYHGSYITHAKFHSKSRFIFQFDIEDAFPSVNISKLERILYRKIIQENIANTVDEADQLANLIMTLTTFNGTLPQGAPTSPFLFYIYILETRLISRLYKCCPTGWKLKISCYVDGIVISAKKPIPPDVQEKLFKTVEETGFEVNKKKIWLRDCRHGAPLITGIRVNGKGRISLPKKKIRQWRGIIHRAAFETDPEKKAKLKQRIEGFIASLKPTYEGKLPAQIEKPYSLFKTNKPA